MELYNTTLTFKSLIHEIWKLCDADITSYPLASVIRRINAALDELVSEIITADGNWQWDDTNYTDQPRGKGTLVEGQEPYTFASEYLQIEAMEILDLDGITYRRIDPLDHTMLDGLSPDEYFGLESDGTPKKGVPRYYDLFTDDSFRLYPAPSATYCTLTNGYRVWFKRKPVHFTMSDDTTITSGEEDNEPGIPSTHHILLAYMSAIPYNEIYHPERIARQEKKIMEMKKGLMKLYANRLKSEPKVMVMASVNPR